MSQILFVYIIYEHTQLIFLIKSSTKIYKIWQSYSPVLLIFSISVPNVVTIGRHLTSFVTCATFNMQKAYAHISILMASKVCPMLKYSDIYDLSEPMAIVILLLNES